MITVASADQPLADRHGGPAEALPSAAVAATGAVSPIVAWDLATLRILLANGAAADGSGYPLAELAGTVISDLVLPRGTFDPTVAALRSGAVDSVRGEFVLRGQDGTDQRLYAWTRTVDVEGARCAATLVLPPAAMRQLSDDPTRPWRELAPIALGTVDEDWTITAVSAEVGLLLGGRAADWLGTGLFDLVHPCDSPDLRGALEGRRGLVSAYRPLRLLRHDGVAAVGLMISNVRLTPECRWVFGLVGQAAVQRTDRMRDLENRLRRIGEEVRAAGLLRWPGEPPSVRDFPQLAELSTRQWEILTRILSGQRVPTIAADLFISPSTVRNHLTGIFQKFGVHSQPQLLRVLRHPFGEMERSA